MAARAPCTWAGAAVVKAIDATLAKARTLAAHLLQASDGELVFADGRFAVLGRTAPSPCRRWRQARRIRPTCRTA